MSSHWLTAAATEAPGTPQKADDMNRRNATTLPSGGLTMCSTRAASRSKGVSRAAHIVDRRISRDLDEAGLGVEQPNGKAAIRIV